MAITTTYTETKRHPTGRTVPEADRRTLGEELAKVIDGEVRFDKTYRALYVSDASNYRMIPLGVVIPRSAEDVVQTMRLCHQMKVPVVSRGGGTSLAGQGCNVAVVIDFSKHMNRILEMDPVNKTVTVEPGVILDSVRTKAQDEYMLTYGPDPATHAWCTLGGMVGNNSCGVHSVIAGRTADNAHELEILTYDGLRMRVGQTSEHELDSIIAEGGRRGQIYRGLKDIHDRYADLIRSRYPKIPRRVSGYNLDDLLPENGFHVARALVGTESTCAITLQAKLRLVDHFPKKSLLVIGYEDIYSAARHVLEVMDANPTACEAIDDKLIDFMKRKGLHPTDVQLLPDGNGWLLVEFGGQTKAESDEKAHRLMSRIEQDHPAPSMRLYDDPKIEAHLWEVRESGLGATAHVPGLPSSWPGWEDSAVDPKDMASYLQDFRKLLTKHGLDASLYGHFGQGCLHCRITFDMQTHDGIKNYYSFVSEAADLVTSYNGSFSGEHGDGQSRAIFLPRMYGPELVHAFEEFKSIWDPDWKLNPGKVVDPNPPDSDLRLGSDFNPWQPETEFHYPEDDGSFSKASLRCVGVGKCRRHQDAFMCPSYLVTHDEKDNTRGRAHLIFEMLRGDFITDGWKSKEVMDVMDYCLGCKGCKKECPVDVDVATYKSEFLYHYHTFLTRPRSTYFMGLIGYWARLAAWMPGLANYFSQTRPFSTLLKAAGEIAQQRQLPQFAAESFTDWYWREKRDSPVQGPSVVLYPDVFNNYFHPQSLKAALEVLEKLSFHVIIPDQRIPEVRPLIHYGLLSMAKRELIVAVERLAHYTRHGVKVVCLEPSTVSVFRDELPSLFPNNYDGQRVSSNVMPLSEFLDAENVQLPMLHRKALLHGHCHQKAVLNMDSIRHILQKMGMEFFEPDEGCCGMAGSFGFEKDHYEVSTKVGEISLLPAARQIPNDTILVADGFSCRHQVEESSSRRPVHLAELLKMAFDEGPAGPRGDRPERNYAYSKTPVARTSTVVLTAAAIGGGLWLARSLFRARSRR